jgi:lipopolysaccharide export system protein LptA
MSVRSFTVLLASLALLTVAHAEPAQQTTGAMQGLQLNRDQPVKIESDALEVRDKSHQATFMGSVKLTQGDTILQCKLLVIFYEDTSAAPAATKKSAPVAQKGGGPGVPGGQQIKRAEAKGDVLVTQKDQTAKGDNGVFDVKANTVTLTGNVVVTQGTNVLRGDRMVVNLDTGVARVESEKTKRVEGLFNPSTTPPPAAAPAPAPAPTAPQKNAKPPPVAPPAAKATPGAPTRIN